MTTTKTKIVSLVLQGYTNPKIATLLHLSKRAVGKHIQSVYKELKIDDPPKRLKLVLALQEQKNKDVLLPDEFLNIELAVLRPCEQNIAELMLSGLNSLHIHKITGLSYKTVEHYKQAIYKNFGGKGRLDADGYNAEILTVIWLKAKRM